MLKRAGLLLLGWALVLALFAAGGGAQATWSEPTLWQHSTAGVERMMWRDGDRLYFAKDYDIYVSEWDSLWNVWLEPEPVPGPINTGANEINPCIVGGGKVMFFARYSPLTDYDFFRAVWDDQRGEWGAPEKIEEISSDDQEWDIWVDEAETVLYLTTRGTFGEVEPVGGRDVWKSTRDGDRWTTPVNLGPPINTEGDEWSIFVDTSGRLYIDGKRDETFGGYDLYVAEDEASEPRNLGSPPNGPDDERSVWVGESEIWISIPNGKGGAGGYDIWYATAQ